MTSRSETLLNTTRPTTYESARGPALGRTRRLCVECYEVKPADEFSDGYVCDDCAPETVAVEVRM